MSADEYTPTWHAGMYGCREDMFSRSALEKIVAEVARAAKAEGKAEALEEAAEKLRAGIWPALLASGALAAARELEERAAEYRKEATDE